MLNALRATVVLALLLILATLLAACSGSGDDDPSPTPSGDPLSDEEYLAVICRGLTSFTDAIVSKTKAEDIATVIRDYVKSLQTVTPPGDLQTFHADYVKYLQDAVAEPTSLLTTKPPLPPDSVRQRLVTKEASVAECRDRTFFETE